MTQQAILMDLDGTLYRCDRLQQSYDQALLKLVAAHIRRSPDAVAGSLEAVMAEYRGLGLRPAMTSFLGTVGLLLDDWYRASVREVDPRNHLSPDLKLRAALASARDHAVLAVVTNNCEVQVHRTLEALGIDDLISYAFSPRTLDEIKPAPRLFERALATLGLSPGSCLMIGDREQVDLEPAARLGMETAVVSGPDDLISVLSGLACPREG